MNNTDIIAEVLQQLPEGSTVTLVEKKTSGGWLLLYEYGNHFNFMAVEDYQAEALKQLYPPTVTKYSLPLAMLLTNLRKLQIDGILADLETH